MSSEKAAMSCVIRKAGMFEEYFNVRNRLDLNSYVISAARYEHPGGLKLTKTLLYPALETVVRAIPALSMQISAPPAAPVFTRMPAMDLNKVVTFMDAANPPDLQKTMEEVLSTPISYGEDMPMWRMVVFPHDGTLLFAYDHTAGDGQSGPAFQLALRAALSAVPPPESTDGADASAHSGLIDLAEVNGALSPTLEEALDVSVPAGIVMRELAKFVAPTLVDRKFKTSWTGYLVQKPGVMETRARIAHLALADMACVVKLARKHGATLTGVLHMMSVAIISGLVLAQTKADGAGAKAVKYKSIPTLVPISLRRFSGVPNTAFCDHVSTYSSYHPLVPPPGGALSVDNFPWKEAAALGESVKAFAPRSARTVGLLKFVHGKFDQYLLNQLGKKRHDGFELSNLGAFPKPEGKAADGSAEDGGWKIREVYFLQGDATIGAAIKLNTVGTPDGGLGLAVTWGKGAIDDEVGEAYFAQLQEGLKMLVDAAEKA